MSLRLLDQPFVRPEIGDWRLVAAQQQSPISNLYRRRVRYFASGWLRLAAQGMARLDVRLLAERPSTFSDDRLSAYRCPFKRNTLIEALNSHLHRRIP